MTEVLFYHLTESKLEEVLPELLEKSVSRGWRVVIQASSEERCDALDTHLWTYADDSFLPHATVREAHAAEQPILITVGGDNPNGATVRFMVEGAEPPGLDGYSRAVILFDGYDAAQLDAARRQWKSLRDAGHSVAYWQQTQDRRWEKKA